MEAAPSNAMVEDSAVTLPAQTHSGCLAEKLLHSGQALRYAQLCAAAYGNGENLPGFRSVAFAGQQAWVRPSTDVAAGSARRVEIIFRGSLFTNRDLETSLDNWVNTNADAALQGTDLNTFEELPTDSAQCQVHRGFLRAYRGIRASIQGCISAEPDPIDVNIIGHSLGGALATLAAADLHLMGHRITVVTFGSPRVGDVAFERVYHEMGLVGRTARYINALDPIPCVPPASTKVMGSVVESTPHVGEGAIAHALDFITRRVRPTALLPEGYVGYTHVCPARCLDNGAAQLVQAVAAAADAVTPAEAAETLYACHSMPNYIAGAEAAYTPAAVAASAVFRLAFNQKVQRLANAAATAGFHVAAGLASEAGILARGAYDVGTTSTAGLASASTASLVKSPGTVAIGAGAFALGVAATAYAIQRVTNTNRQSLSPDSDANLAQTSSSTAGLGTEIVVHGGESHPLRQLGQCLIDASVPPPPMAPKGQGFLARRVAPGHCGGFGVLNLSSMPINVGMSYGGVSNSFENMIEHGQVFYRPARPFGVRTVYALVGEDITIKTVVKEGAVVLASGVAAALTAGTSLLPAAVALSGPAATMALAAEGGYLGIAATAVAAGGAAGGTAFAASTKLLDVLEAVPSSDKYCQKMNCCGGSAFGDGSWLVVRGGAFVDESTGNVSWNRLTLEKSNRQYVLNNGELSEHSGKLYAGGLPGFRTDCQGHDCERCQCRTRVSFTG